ncbi:MAG: LicD family protein [Blautia massiliensis]|uniref:LicD family protein n=1 Tax=Blautia massiliensis (ex Durand et al. 2017) TaxID=1737424 RepID=UPI00243143CB|nr:LicD family protein [Blautia massiliensis (ex Durand et al. 2017)]MCI7604908.1 LicD family protein [Blautia massiliensis (ex Durand et al. 2017)]
MDSITLRKVQLAQLEIAKEIKRVCEENDIKYFLDSGTLLGAVRHKGFIPWDDDMDIGMLRAEYDKFVEIAPEKLGKNYFLQTWKSDPGYPFPYAKVRKLGTCYIENVSQASGAHNELFVDIFPYDACPDDKNILRKQSSEVTLYRYALQMKNKIKPWTRHHKVWKRILGSIKYFPFMVYAFTQSRNSLIQKNENSQTRFNGLKTAYYEAANASSYASWTIPAECFETLKVAQFEDDIFLIPGNANLYLKAAYGDYMQLPPVEERGNQHQIIELKL